MTKNLEDEFRAIVASMDEQENTKSQDTTQPPKDDIQDVYVLIVREQEEDQVQVVESIPSIPTQPAPATLQQDTCLSAYLFVCFSFLLIASTIAFQLYCIANPLVATITIIPKSQQVTLSGTMQLGRVLPPLTISQSQTAKTTGIGHQPAAQARGYITFYNGQFQMVTIAQGTILTGASGIAMVTDQDATIPAGNPPSYGQTTIAAHAMNPGSGGNIPAYDIHQACCTQSVLAKNTMAFSGGQDDRTYATVTQHDIHSISTVLTSMLTHSVTGALQGQLKPEEQLTMLPCRPTVTSDHQAGEEATAVKVTASETCSAIAYNRAELQTKATAFLAAEAQHKTGATSDVAGAGYSLFATPRVSVTQTSVSHTSPPLVFLSFQATGIWVYGISQQSQQHIKQLIAGKNTQLAEQFLAALPGIEHTAIRFTGIGDTARLPKQSKNIHLVIIVL